MKLSYIILTYNRKDAVLRTLGQIARHTPLLGDDWETWVVDNGSKDDTAQAIEQAYPQVQLIRRATNEGIWARQYALDRAAGTYVCFLDDDSYPIDDAVTRSIRFLDDNPSAGGVTGRVLMADGSHEASALPVVPAIGALCARRAALERAGGLRPCRSFIRQAEEYDLAFRILESGYTLDRFEDLVYRHEKPPGARASALIHRLDMRNNLIILYRYVPSPLRRAYRQDWTLRYGAIAKYRGFATASKRGLWGGLARAVTQGSGAKRLARSTTIETVFELQQQSEAVAAWSAAHNVRRVAIADFGKNIYATYNACVTAGLQIKVVADEQPAFAGLRYRGLPVLPDLRAIEQGLDGIVLSNINPAQTDRRFTKLKNTTNLPILRLWHPRVMAASLGPEPAGATALAIAEPSLCQVNHA